MSSIFLSHSSKDNGIAGQVKTRLEQLGHRSVFLDFDPENGIPAGRNWEKELYAKLRECRAVIILCSHASMASRWCFAEITHAKAMGKSVFPVKLDDAQVDCVLTSVQVIDATAGWDAAYHRLEKGLLDAGLDPKDLFDWDTTRPVYPGLLAFQEQDAAIFFGRDKEIREGQALLNRIQQFGGSRLTLMLGASGSGKSSLMRAGLLPRLKRGQQWVVVDPVRPLQAPFDELATVLSKRLSLITTSEREVPVPDLAHVQDRINWDEGQSDQSVNRFLQLMKELRDNAGSRDATVLLMIDQCEELLTIGANEEGNRFLAFLRAVLDRDDSQLMVLATLRSDFLGSFQDHPAMRGLPVETFPVPQMQVDDFASVIEDPARIAGLELGPGLVQAMINDTKTSDALPLLAFTLRELYEGFGQDKLLTLGEYRDKLGRLDGCVARVAEAVLTAKQLSEKDLSDLRTAFLSMVRVTEKDQYAKQPAQWNDLPASVHDALARFVFARLLISSGDERGRTLEIAHEALFRAWPRLADWLKDNKSFLVWQQRLKDSIERYQESRGKLDFLLRGFPLTEALEWLKKKPDSFSSHERQFVTASKTRQSTRRWAAATVGCLVLVLILGTTWLWQKGFTIDQATLKIHSLFVSIAILPEMQSIPSGNFVQGDVNGIGFPAELPLHEVKIIRFAIAKSEVTFEEYDRFAIASGRALPDDQGWGRGRRPVINVSWYDASQYAEWLSKQSGEHYRLPTESEWEYAARNEPKGDIWGGTSDENAIIEYAVYPRNAKGRPAEVMTKRPNDRGLYDMSGNVWEWVQDCWHENYENAPIDGAAWLQDADKCDDRVVRGGSWYNAEIFLRTSNRHKNNAANRANMIGFRLARGLAGSS